jgi:hypothetical protein
MTLRIVLVAGVLVSGALALAQSSPAVIPADAQVTSLDIPEPASPESEDIVQFEIPTPNAPTINLAESWEGAQAIGSSHARLFVVTFDKPDRRQTCRIQSFTPESIVCSRGTGGSHSYLRQQVAALIVPGDGDSKRRFVLGLNAGMGAAIWGTVVLAATCPACAVATGIVAFLLFSAAGAVLIGDDQPDRLLYLAPGQELSRKLGFVQK